MADLQCVALKTVLAEQVGKLAAAGVTDFYSGMADGSDVWLAQIVLDLRKENPELKLHCVLPCEGQADQWSVAAQERYHMVLHQADEVFYVNQVYNPKCMLERNRHLVDRASILLAVYKWGTAQRNRGNDPLRTAAGSGNHCY